MCGRYNLKTSGQQLAKQLGIALPEDFSPNENVSPTQLVPMIVQELGGSRKLVLASWGLVPNWVKDTKDWKIRINARKETVATNGCFREAFQRRRCLVPMSGFYEWQKLPGGKKQPFEIVVLNSDLFCVAGIWEEPVIEYQDPFVKDAPAPSKPPTLSILTCPPNELMQPIHDRMPVIVDGEDWECWLASGSKKQALETIMVPYPSEKMATSMVQIKGGKVTPKTPQPVQKRLF